jgi:uncharacterized protein
MDSKTFLVRGTALVVGLSATLAATGAVAQTAVRSLPPEDTTYAALRPYWIERPVIEVIGRASLDFQPNRARLMVQMEAMDPDADRAQMAVSDRARAAVARVQQLAGSKAKVTAVATREEVYEQYRTRDGTRVENERSDKVEFYVQRWAITVVLEDPALASRVRAELLAAGNAQELGSVGFWFEPSPAETRALFQAAVDDGTARAEIAARASGGARLRLLVMQEGQQQCLSVPTNQGGALDYSARAMAAPPAPPPPPPPPGSSSRRLTASDVTLPADPETTRMQTSVCMVFALDR